MSTPTADHPNSHSSDCPPAGNRTARESIRRTETPAFSCLLDGTILNWNSGAERAFGVEAAEALGGRCYEIIAGRDVFGNDYCSRHCPIREMACRERTIQPFHISVRNDSRRRVAMRTIILLLGKGGGQTELVHLFDPLASASEFGDAQPL